MSDSGHTDVLTAKDTTDGIDIDTWTVPYGGKEITYSAWDFAGQTVYYNTHQVPYFNIRDLLILINKSCLFPLI